MSRVPRSWRHQGCDRPGAPQLWPEAPGNVAFDFVAPVAATMRELQAGRAPVRVGCPYRGSHRDQPAHRRRLARNPRRRRRATTPRRTDTCCARRRRVRACCATSSPPASIIPPQKTAPAHRRRRRRLRHEDGGLSGICRDAGRGQAGRPPGALDVDARRSVSERQPGARHRSQRRGSPSTPRAASSRLKVSAIAAVGAIPVVARRLDRLEQFRALLSRHVSHPATSRWMCAASSPTRCRWAPIAAPGGPRPTMRSSGWSRPPPR